MALGFWRGSSENHEIGEALFRDLERRGLALSRRILFVTDNGSGLLKGLWERFGKKLVHQRCAIHKSRNLQRHLAKPYRNEAHRQLTTALEQTSYAEAKQMLRELEVWLRTKNKSAADSLLEAFEEMRTILRRNPTARPPVLMGPEAVVAWARTLSATDGNDTIRKACGPLGLIARGPELGRSPSPNIPCVTCG